MASGVGIMRKIIAGDRHRRTRLHDEKGNIVDAGEWKHLPSVLHRVAARKLFGRLYDEPWWTFTIKERVAALLRPDMTVVEFGAGQSTLWLAPHVGRLLSIEHDPAWWERTRGALARRGLTNVDLQLRGERDYADLAGVPDGSVDFCVIDGLLRGVCTRAVLPKMRPGGWIYLDNSDKDMDFADDGRNLRAAEAMLLRHAAPADVRYVTGFTIGSLNAQQGMLVRWTGLNQPVPPRPPVA
ncbi:hypothetical protein HL658_09700 [Azospirillum sp. RWY-5-1]|uniref:Class I SAM-dependent methyltransferase n=1 Tax=Azospirillum oleiclasticum TaxID=2735135 RepID=A0ABX2TBB9_9PROT|nr:class I SAM-dependent methyltransferase [Azospirillum oleiclasticum]NYZ12825.1 hypothetical protein [Azospirillum oleiclasticum]NYZ19985.1 hypothetical protein [Azospirillum oleiclasticum]